MNDEKDTLSKIQNVLLKIKELDIKNESKARKGKCRPP